MNTATQLDRDAPSSRALERDDPMNGLVAFYWTPNRPRTVLSLPEQIAAEVGDRIIAGRYAPGERLIEQELSDEFAASRGPVREALRILERERLVRIQPRRGASVTELSLEEVSDLFEIRASLYRKVSERIARSRAPEQLRLLEQTVETLKKCCDADDDGASYSATVFRQSLNVVRAAGNKTLGDIVTSLALRSLRYTRLALRSRERRLASVQNWIELLEATRRGDAQAAGELSAQQIERSRDEALRLLEQD